MSRRRVALLTALSCLFLAGCTNETTVGETTVYTYQLWVSFVAIAVGAAVTAFGWTQRNESWRAWIAIVAGGLMTVGFCPFAFFDKLVVDETHLEGRWGFWMFPTRHDIRFDDVGHASLTKKVTTGRRGRKTSYYLNFHLKNGQTEELSLGNDLVEAAFGRIAATLGKKMIPVIDNTGN